MREAREERALPDCQDASGVPGWTCVENDGATRAWRGRKPTGTMPERRPARERRSYTEAEKDEACLIYVEQGPTEVYRRLGIPPTTVVSWAQARGLRTMRNEKTRARTEAREVDAGERRSLLRQKLLDKALDALERMDEAHKDFRGKDAAEVSWDKAPSGAMKDYAMTAAILIDKLRLEEGSATARTEHVDPQQRAAEVLDQLAARRAKRGVV